MDIDGNSHGCLGKITPYEKSSLKTRENHLTKMDFASDMFITRRVHIIFGGMFHQDTRTTGCRQRRQLGGTLTSAAGALGKIATF